MQEPLDPDALAFGDRVLATRHGAKSMPVLCGSVLKNSVSFVTCCGVDQSLAGGLFPRASVTCGRRRVCEWTPEMSDVDFGSRHSTCW